MNKGFKKLCMFVLCISLVWQILSGIVLGEQTGNDEHYTDLKGHWAEEIIREMISEDYIKGELVKGKLIINPDRPITRAEFVVVLTKVKDYERVVDGIERFSDVEVNSWYSEAIAIAAGNGIIDGYPDDTFGPNRSITRAEASTIISNSNELNQEENLSYLDSIEEFNDIAKSDWFYNNVMLCRLFDIINGYPDESFRPKNNITRAEAFVMIYKSIEQGGVEIHEPDVTPTDSQSLTPTPTSVSEPTKSIPGSDGNSGNTKPSSSPEGENVDLTDFSIIKSHALIAIGEEYTLQTNFEPFAATNKKVFWSSENPEILSVNAEGKITGISEGTTTIFARTQDGDFEDSCLVTVETDQIIIEDIDIDRPMLEPNETANISIFAKSKNNSELHYDCEVEAGTVSTSMYENVYMISWTAPDVEGVYSLNIKITYNGKKSIVRKLRFWVGEYYDTIDIDKNLPPDGDFDNDGLTNAEELLFGTDPRNPDTDGDGLSDFDEIYKYKTNPLKSDSDGDDIVDGAEILLKTNPLVPDEQEIFEIEIEAENVEVVILGSGNNALSTITECDNGMFNSYKGLIGVPYELKTPEEIENTKVSINYDKAEIEEKKIDENELTMYKYRYETGIVEEMTDIYIDTKSKSIDGKTESLNSGKTVFFIGTTDLSNAKIGNFDIVFALDMSDNMKTIDENCTWKESLTTLVDIASDESKMSVIQSVYSPSNNVEIIEEMTTDKDIIRYGIKDLMYKLSAGKGSLTGMFEKAFDMLSTEAGTNGRVVIAVLSTCTEEEYELLADQIRTAVSDNIVVHIVTTTDDISQRDRMMQLAETGGGRFVYIPSQELTKICISDLVYDFRQLVNARRISKSKGVLMAASFNSLANPMADESETKAELELEPEPVVTMNDFDFSKHTYSFTNKAENIYTDSAHCAGMSMTVLMNYLGLLPSVVELTDRDNKLDKRTKGIDFDSETYAYNLFPGLEYQNVKNKDINSLTETEDINKMLDYWWFRLNDDLASYAGSFISKSSIFDNHLDNDYINQMCSSIDSDCPIYIGVGNTYNTGDKNFWILPDYEGHFHGIVAYNYQKTYDDGELCKVEFGIYDCNKPGDNSRKLVCTRNKNKKDKYKDEWKYEYVFSGSNLVYSSDEDFGDGGIIYRRFRSFNLELYKKFVMKYFTNNQKSNVKFKEDYDGTEIVITLPTDKVGSYKLYDIYSDECIEVDELDEFDFTENKMGDFTKITLKSSKYYNQLVVGIDSSFVERQINHDDGNPWIVNMQDVYPDVFQSPYTNFSDIKSNHWCIEEIRGMKAKEIISGYPDGNFYPYKSITRAEFIKIVMSACGIYYKPGDQYRTANYYDKYTDLKGHWAGSYCTLALAEGWVKPKSESAFKPNEEITREESASVLWNIISSNRAKNVKSLIKNDTLTTTYKDDNMINEEYRSAVAHLYINKIMTGYINKLFLPGKEITRAEVCKIVYNALIQ